MADNNVFDRGWGKWVFCIYNPTCGEAGNQIGPFEGTLEITKDFHCVVDDNKDNIYTASIPSQNVAYAINKDKISVV